MGTLKALIVLVVALTASTSAVAKTPVILSTDVGNEIDDQWAIAYMMLNPDSGYNSYLILKDEIENRLNMSEHPPILPGGDLPLENAHTPRMNAAVQFLIAGSKSYSANNRLTIVGIGATTDIASAILADPSIVDRVRIVAMGFASQDSAQEYNVQNDVHAWQVLFNAHVPLIIGPGDVCKRDLGLHYDQAKTLLADDGPVGSWLWSEFNEWYYRYVKPPRKDDFANTDVIWDIITLAYLEGMTTEEVRSRPVLGDDLVLSHPDARETVTWITGVDSVRLWASFQGNMKAYLSTHFVPTQP
jgi:purine nucleosidase